MKAFILILFTCLALSAKATDIPLDSIYNAVFAFQKKTEQCNYEERIDYLFDPVTQKYLKQSDIGIYQIYYYASPEYVNFIIIEKKSFQLINMHDPLEKNVEIFFDYFKRNNIPDKLILKYLSYLASIAKRNEYVDRSHSFYIGPRCTREIERKREQVFDISQCKIKRFSPKSDLSYFIYSAFGITNLGIIEKKKVSLLNMYGEYFDCLTPLINCMIRNNTKQDEIFKYIRLLNKTYSENHAHLDSLFKSPVSEYDTIVLKVNGQKARWD